MANDRKKYFKAEPEVFLEYNFDDKRSRTLIRPEVKDALEQAKSRLAELPQIDDKYLLEWAKEHFDQMDVVRERADGRVRLTRLADGVASPADDVASTCIAVRDLVSTLVDSAFATK